MTNSYKENFEKTRLAGTIAAGALDEVAKIVRPGIQTDEIDKLCYEYINDHGAYSAPLFIEGFQNRVVHLLIMLFVMEFHLIKF